MSLWSAEEPEAVLEADADPAPAIDLRSSKPAAAESVEGRLIRLIEVTLPELGAGHHEAMLDSWQHHPGDRVEEDDLLCIVTADGMRAAVASSVAGRVVRHLVACGALLEPGESLIEIGGLETSAHGRKIG